MAGRAASKSPGPVRRSSRQSTPVREPASPPPTRTTRSSAAGLPTSASTPSLASLVPPSASRATPTSPGSGIRKSASTRALSPRVAARVQRPVLPQDKANKLMLDQGGKSPKVHKVKTQTLHLGEGAGTITIARVKCPVPKGTPGHIIKRFDTDAVSASSLFRAAFPSATTEEEAVEMRWIAVGSRGQYGDTVAAGNEGDETKKLSGTWVPSTHALALAEEYGVARFTVDLVAYSEDDRGSAPDTPEVDDSPALRSPRAKRARVSSPLAGKTQALSGASGPGISIMQTLERTQSGTVTESTEVKIDVPVPAEGGAGEDAPAAFDEAGEAQVKAAKQLVEDLKASGTLAELTESTTIPDAPSSSSSAAVAPSKKRTLEPDEDALPQSGTLADTLEQVDNRSFFSKLFRRKRKAGPTQASRETRPLPAPRAGQQQVPEIVVREEDEQGEGRRWAAGVGLAVAVGATAAAPYLFG
ncbi:hypothetical protein JCM8097_002020 [Rhodosporidiobolus ruineniae]